jgi:hypothetical protein
VSTPSASPASAGTRTGPGAGLGRAAGVAWIAAVLLNLALLAVARGPLGIEVVHPDPPGSDTLGVVQAVHVVVSTTVGSLLAVIGAALARRLVPRPRTAFLVVGGVVALLSLGGPFSVTGASGASTAVLLVMHVVAAGALLPSLARVLPADREAA